MVKKIDVIVPFYSAPFLGGTETVLRDWNDWFQKKNDDIDVRFIVPFKQKEGYIFKEKRSNHVVAPSLFKNPAIVKMIGAIFLAVFLFFTNSDAVIVLSPKYIKISKLVQIVFKKKYKVVSWMHFSLKSMFTGEGAAFRSADYHLAISTGIEEQLSDMGIKNSNISVIFNPISRKQCTIMPSETPVFVFVGRLEMYKQKNVTELLQGFRLFLNEQSNAQLKIIGDGPDRMKLEMFSHTLGLDSTVEFLGWSKAPFHDVKNATALVLTSNFEGLPMVLLEAVSYGLPVVSSDIETGPSDIVNVDNGLLYNAGDVSMLAEQLLAVYSKNLNHEQAKDSIHEFYNDSYFSRVVGILKQI